MTQDEDRILLCDGCAAEAGVNDDEHAVPPGTLLDDAACNRCGAILVGFAYWAPADTYTGMAPGAG
jgi:hypothetical protein